MYFTDAQAGGRAHFQHHYFKLGLIAHFHRVSLLNFKVRIANALEEWRAAGADAEQGWTRFARALAVLQRDFLMFRNMYWFTELTNQIQGRELFDLWSQHLNTRPLFDQIKAELQEAEQIVGGWQRQRMVQEQSATQRQLVELAGKQGAMQEELAFAIAVAGIAFYVLDLRKHLLQEKRKSFLLTASPPHPGPAGRVASGSAAPDGGSPAGTDRRRPPGPSTRPPRAATAASPPARPRSGTRTAARAARSGSKCGPRARDAVDRRRRKLQRNGPL